MALESSFIALSVNDNVLHADIVDWKRSCPDASRRCLTPNLITAIENRRATLRELSTADLDDLYAASSYSLCSGSCYKNGPMDVTTVTLAEFKKIHDLFHTFRTLRQDRIIESWTSQAVSQSGSAVKIDRFMLNFSLCSQSNPCSHQGCTAVFSDGRTILYPSLNGDVISMLLKALPHEKIVPCANIEASEQLSESDQKFMQELSLPQTYFAHFNQYDLPSNTPEVVRQTFNKLFQREVQVETNEVYFDLLRQHVMNSAERFKERTGQSERCWFECIVYLESLIHNFPETRSATYRQDLEKYVLYLLILKSDFISSGSLYGLEIVSSISKRMVQKFEKFLQANNVHVDLQSNIALNEYLKSRGIDLDRVRETIPEFKYEEKKKFMSSINEHISLFKEFVNASLLRR